MKEEKKLRGLTEKHHRFEVKGLSPKLRLVRKVFGYPLLADTKCVLFVDGDQRRQRLGGTVDFFGSGTYAAAGGRSQLTH